MAPTLTDREQYLRRVESLALSALPITALPMVASPPAHHDGVMVALVPEAPEELALDHPEALTSDDLHITLCYIGKVQDLSNADMITILSKARRVCDEIGHSFTTSADGVIVMGTSDDGVPATALLIQSDDIVNLYNAMAETLEYKSKFPSFIPHMTTGYGVPIEMAQERIGQSINFNNVLVKFGDARIVIPLTSGLVAAPRGANTIDRVMDSLGRLWDEALHPRDGEGKFIKKNGAISGKLSIPSADRKSVNVVDANRASVVGFRTIDNEVWVLAEATNPDGTKVQGFAKADEVHAVAPIKARLDALYPIENDAAGLPTANSLLERHRQLDLLLAHIDNEYGLDDVDSGLSFLDTLGLWKDDRDYLYDGELFRPIDHDLTPDESEEVADIIADAKQVKELRDRVHGIKTDTAESGIESVGDLMDKYEKLNVHSFLSEKDGLITLSKVIVGDQEKGTGTAFMQDLTEYADRTDKIVGLTPSSDFGGSKKRLVEFYKRFDFVENKGKNRDFEISEDMYRIPDEPSKVDVPETHVVPAQKLLDTPGDVAVREIAAGADPFETQTDNLFEAMKASGRFELLTPDEEVETGISQIHWFEDTGDATGYSAPLAGLHKATTNKAYFVKESAIGAEFDNSDIVKEVLASLIAKQIADITNGDDRALLVPRSVFGDNPEWNGESPPEVRRVNWTTAVHQPAHVISEHGVYLVPADWKITDSFTEEIGLNNDIRDADPEIAEDMKAAYHEDMGNIYGHEVAKMILFDFAIMNSDRNGNNAILGLSPDESESRAVLIDHGSAFDDIPTDHVTGEDLEIDDNGEMFEWFMEYSYTRGWRDWVRGGLRLNDNVTEDSLRQVIADFSDVYGGLNGNDVASQFSAIPGVTESQIERVRTIMDGVVERIDWIVENQDAVFDGVTSAPQASVVP